MGLSACVSFPVMAWISVQTGFSASKNTIENTSQAQRLTNMKALQSSMTPLIIVPWLMCAAFYCTLHVVLPKDLARVRRIADAERSANAELITVELSDERMEFSDMLGTSD